MRPETSSTSTSHMTPVASLASRKVLGSKRVSTSTSSSRIEVRGLGSTEGCERPQPRPGAPGGRVQSQAALHAIGRAGSRRARRCARSSGTAYTTPTERAARTARRAPRNHRVALHHSTVPYMPTRIRLRRPSSKSTWTARSAARNGPRGPGGPSALNTIMAGTSGGKAATFGQLGHLRGHHGARPPGCRCCPRRSCADHR